MKILLTNCLVLMCMMCCLGSDFNRKYTGSIDGKYGITMQLQCQGKALQGTYSYNMRGIPIRISGSIDWLDAGRGNLTLLEFNDKGMVTGFFRGELSANQITGSWSTPDGKRVLGFMLQTDAVAAAPATPPAKSTVVVTPAKEKPAGPLKADCVSEEPSADEIRTTCTFRDFKAVSHGLADMAGRFTYNYTLYRKEGSSYIQVSNATMFNAQGLQALEREINERIRKDVVSMRSAEPECFSNFEWKDYLINQLGVYFRDDQIFFSVEFDIPSACRSVGGTVVSFSLSEIQPFLLNP